MDKKIDQFQKLSINDYKYADYNIKNLVSNQYVINLPELNSFVKSLSNLEGIVIEKNKLPISEDIVNLENNSYIQNEIILKAVLALLGSINLNNDFTKFTNDFNSNIENNKFLQNSNSLQEHIISNINTIFTDFNTKDLKLYIKSLEEIGVNILKSEIYSSIKNYVMSNNKLLIIITPSENFWIKSDKDKINKKSFDKKLNNYNNIFYNWSFIRKFYDRVANHPRCLMGYLNSMLLKNLKPCIEFISLEVKNFTKFIVFDQNCHENKEKDVKKKPIFVRDLNKIIKTARISNGVDETNLIIIESECDKIESTKDNSIEFDLFNEDYFYLSEEDKKKKEDKIDHLNDYLVNLLEECDDDIREYISHNKLIK